MIHHAAAPSNSIELIRLFSLSGSLSSSLFFGFFRCVTNAGGRHTKMFHKFTPRSNFYRHISRMRMCTACVVNSFVFRTTFIAFFFFAFFVSNQVRGMRFGWREWSETNFRKRTATKMPFDWTKFFFLLSLRMWDDSTKLGGGRHRSLEVIQYSQSIWNDLVECCHIMLIPSSAGVCALFFFWVNVMVNSRITKCDIFLVLNWCDCY